MPEEEDPWANVFAKAEGHDSFAATRDTEPSISVDDESSNKNEQPFISKKQKNKKKQKIHEKPKGQPGSWQSHLMRRSRADISIFDWDEVKLHNGLGDHDVCSMWKSSSTDNRCCQECGKPPFHHILSVSSVSSQSSWVWDAYCSFRNLRCIAIWNLLKASDKKNSKGTRKLAKRSFKLLEYLWNKHRSQLTGTILENAWDNLLQQLRRITKKDSTVKTNIELIMACDDCYLKLYYLDLTAIKAKLAHPVAYFGESLRTMREYVAKHGVLDDLVETVCDRYNVASSFLNLNEMDALTALHQMRFLETLVLFRRDKPESYHQSTWLVSTDTASSLEKHDTPAPPLLSRWRDSCRDFLTHLYGYATIPPSHLQAIAEFAKGTTILELGAGTGYLAHLLQQLHVAVQPLDVAPTTPSAKKRKRQQSNDYHASTPPFTQVEEGTAATMKLVMRQHASKTFTLLLAYPPPDSEMGYETLRVFHEAGGSKLIHVGEFCGLTGTQRMEQYLLQHGSRFMGQSKDIPCPTWGTDSAFISFWNLTSVVNAQPSPLLLCQNCQSRPAIKRLRILRHLCFCRESCWKQFQESGEIQQHSICSSLNDQIREEALDFDDPRHFLRLPVD